MPRRNRDIPWEVPGITRWLGGMPHPQARDALERGGDTPLQGPCLCPANVSPTASANFNGIGNRQ